MIMTFNEYHLIYWYLNVFKCQQKKYHNNILNIFLWFYNLLLGTKVFISSMATTSCFDDDIFSFKHPMLTIHIMMR